MKKILSLFLCAALALALTACGTGEQNTGNGSSGSTETGSPVPENALFLKLKLRDAASAGYEKTIYHIEPDSDELLVGYAANKKDIYYIITDYAESQYEHTQYDFYKIDQSSGESERVLSVNENGESFHISKPVLAADHLFFLATTSDKSGISCFDPENKTIELIEELPVNASNTSFAGDDRYLAWIFEENGSLKLHCFDTQSRKTELLSSSISPDFGVATLFVNEGICTVLEEASYGSYAVSYDLATKERLSEKVLPEEFDIRRLQGSRSILSLTDGLGKDALTYIGSHTAEGLSPLYKESGEHISSFSSHIYGNVMVINSQYPQEVLIIYPEEGVYESIPLDAPLFAASVSPDGLFTGLDTQGNNLICIEIK